MTQPGHTVRGTICKPYVSDSNRRDPETHNPSIIGVTCLLLWLGVSYFSYRSHCRDDTPVGAPRFSTPGDRNDTTDLKERFLFTFLLLWSLTASDYPCSGRYSRRKTPSNFSHCRVRKGQEAQRVQCPGDKLKRKVFRSGTKTKRGKVVTNTCPVYPNFLHCREVDPFSNPLLPLWSCARRLNLDGEAILSNKTTRKGRLTSRNDRLVTS